jgi:hypothetical protein
MGKVWLFEAVDNFGSGTLNAERSMLIAYPASVTPASAM